MTPAQKVYSSDYESLILRGISQDDFVPQEEMEEIGRALAGNTSLTSLTIARSSRLRGGYYGAIGDQGALVLARALAINTTVRQLELPNNSIGPGGASALVKALAVNTHVEELNLSGNPIGIESVEELFSNTRLIALKIYSITERCDFPAKMIVKALVENRTLTALTLSDCLLTGIAEPLKINTTLAELTLDGNAQAYWEGVVPVDIPEEEIHALAMTLIAHPTLTSFSMRFHRLGTCSADAIAAVVQHNTTLVELNVDGNDLCDEGVGKIVTALGQNSSLTAMGNLGRASFSNFDPFYDCSNNFIDDYSLIDKLKDLFERNLINSRRRKETLFSLLLKHVSL